MDSESSPYNLNRSNFPFQLHLTLLVESRVLRLQSMCRCRYKVRRRAAESIQGRLALLNVYTRTKAEKEPEEVQEPEPTAEHVADRSEENGPNERRKAPVYGSSPVAGQSESW